MTAEHTHALGLGGGHAEDAGAASHIEAAKSRT
jgi:hypothetical protein